LTATTRLTKPATESTTPSPVTLPPIVPVVDRDSPSLTATTILSKILAGTEESNVGERVAVGIYRHVGTRKDQWKPTPPCRHGEERNRGEWCALYHRCVRKPTKPTGEARGSSRPSHEPRPLRGLTFSFTLGAHFLHRGGSGDRADTAALQSLEGPTVARPASREAAARARGRPARLRLLR